MVFTPFHFFSLFFQPTVTRGHQSVEVFSLPLIRKHDQDWLLAVVVFIPLCKPDHGAVDVLSCQGRGSNQESCKEQSLKEMSRSSLYLFMRL